MCSQQHYIADFTSHPLIEPTGSSNIENFPLFETANIYKINTGIYIQAISEFDRSRVDLSEPDKNERAQFITALKLRLKCRIGHSKRKFHHMGSNKNSPSKRKTIYTKHWALARNELLPTKMSNARFVEKTTQSLHALYS